MKLMMSLIMEQVPQLSICSCVCGCVLVMMSSSLLTALPLSEAHLKNVFENTRNLGNLCSWLRIPRDKRTAASAAEHYKKSTEPRKGRRMVFWLDWNGDTALADSVMECAEPPAGKVYMYVYIPVPVHCSFTHFLRHPIRHTQLMHIHKDSNSVDLEIRSIVIY